MRQIYAGKICCDCSARLPERTDGRSGERRCVGCVEKNLRTVFLNFIHRNGWHISFLEADAQTSLPWRGTFLSTEPIVALIRKSYQPVEAEREFENCVRHWGQGTVTLRLTAEQHLKLRRPNRRPA